MNVYITNISEFFPNAPITNEDMECHLGMINGKPSRAKNIILRKNGIKKRYYALDSNGEVTHTNVQMAAMAIRNLMGENLADIDLLSCGTASPEQLIPSHGVMVHGALPECRNAEVVSFAGSCCTGMDALKYAAMAVTQGDARNAVVSASERISAWMRASYFQRESEIINKIESNPMLAFEKDFLRWMLSDGALALLLQPQPDPNRISLRIEWIEKTSYANELNTCMYAGADKDENGNLRGWSLYPEQEWLNKSLFAVKQDTRMLDENIVKCGIKFLKEICNKHHFSTSEIDWFMPHLSSMYFKPKILKALDEAGMSIPEARWFVNLPEVGNIASASAFAMLNGLIHTKELRKGQKLLVLVPESARFSYSLCMLTTC